MILNDGLEGHPPRLAQTRKRIPAFPVAPLNMPLEAQGPYRPAYHRSEILPMGPRLTRLSVMDS